jgi:uncharacterized glyoxalase superfamily protein PhnB
MTVQSLFPILRTTDPAALADFYSRALGGEITYAFGEDFLSLDLGAAHLGIGREAEPVRGQQVALWFYVDDVDAAFAAALRSGASPVEEPADMPWGERVAQIRDPDGNAVYLGRAAAG